MAAATWVKLSEPVAPYNIDIPYNMKPEASAPSTKYFIAASVEIGLSRRSATSAYKDSDINSSRRSGNREVGAAETAGGVGVEALVPDSGRTVTAIGRGVTVE